MTWMNACPSDYYSRCIEKLLDEVTEVLKMSQKIELMGYIEPDEIFQVDKCTILSFYF